VIPPAPPIVVPAVPAVPEPPPAPVIPPAPPIVVPAVPAVPALPEPPVARPTPAQVEELPPGFGEDDEAIADSDAFFGEKPVRPTDLDEWLFDKSMDINEAMDIPDAARTSLQILVDLVGAESGCVLYGDYNCTALEFIAAAGPTAHKLRGVHVEIESSLAGFCHRMGFGLLVADTSKDARFDQSVDARTGYRTRAILAVPLRTTDGWTYGCLELLNAPWGFEEWMMDASQNIATTLAGFIHVRL
jgi:hypothetical protein